MAWLWLVLGVALAIAEMFTSTFVLLMLAAGALAAAAVAALGLPVWLQGLVFAAVSAAALAGVRPLIQRHWNRTADPTPVGLAAIEGAVVPVIELVSTRILPFVPEPLSVLILFRTVAPVDPDARFIPVAVF